MKAALIGLGRMGLRHLDNLLALQLEIVGVCDPLEAGRAAAREKANLRENCLFSDPVQLIQQAKPELLIIATTAPSHADLTCLAADNGVKAILCEKPTATSIADARCMITTCKANDTRLAINHQMRFMDQYILPKEMLASEQFGGVTSMHVTAGNFGLAMNGSHCFEMCRFIAGSPITEIQAWFSDEKVPNPRGPQFEDRAGCIRAKTASGVRFTMDASADQGHGVRVSYAAKHGQIFVDELGGKMNWTVRLPEHREMPTTRYGMPWEEGAKDIPPADALAPSLSVLKALLDDNNYPSGEDGLATISALVAAYTSDQENHRIVRLAEPLPEDIVFPWA